MVLLVGGWICIRTATYAPGWWVPEGVAAPATASPRRPAAAASVAPRGGPAIARPERAASFRTGDAIPETLLEAADRLPPLVAPPPPRAAPTPSLALSVSPARADFRPETVQTAFQRLGPAIAAEVPGRWSGSAWLFLRRHDGQALAQGGTLGGSQAGLRIGYRLNGDSARPLSVAARLYAPASDPGAAEAALGLEWRPVAGFPLTLAAERRQALGRGGRSALALGAHGGVSDARLPGGLRLDAWGQAGIVGARARDLYADGAARVTTPVGRFDLGAGLSGGAQPGAARLDAGPLLSLRLSEARMRVSAEWRFRIAGDAMPGSGPALTIGTDF